MCGCIPVLEVNDLDYNAFEAPFYYYRTDQPQETWTYRQDWVDAN